jgi:Mn2+/Fe2+ NRAMP family transporter
MAAAAVVAAVVVAAAVVVVAAAAVAISRCSQEVSRISQLQADQRPHCGLKAQLTRIDLRVGLCE